MTHLERKSTLSTPQGPEGRDRSPAEFWPLWGLMKSDTEPVNTQEIIPKSLNFNEVLSCLFQLFRETKLCDAYTHIAADLGVGSFS